MISLGDYEIYTKNINRFLFDKDLMNLDNNIYYNTLFYDINHYQGIYFDYWRSIAMFNRF